MCQLRALLDEKLGKVESARPALHIVKKSAPADPPRERPPIFMLGPIENRRRTLRG
jgi:hypothetical protein